MPSALLTEGIHQIVMPRQLETDGWRMIISCVKGCKESAWDNNGLTILFPASHVQLELLAPVLCVLQFLKPELWCLSAGSQKWNADAYTNLLQICRFTCLVAQESWSTTQQCTISCWGAPKEERGTFVGFGGLHTQSKLIITSEKSTRQSRQAVHNMYS